MVGLTPPSAVSPEASERDLLLELHRRVGCIEIALTTLRASRADELALMRRAVECVSRLERGLDKLRLADALNRALADQERRDTLSNGQLGRGVVRN